MQSKRKRISYIDMPHEAALPSDMQYQTHSYPQHSSQSQSTSYAGVAIRSSSSASVNQSSSAQDQSNIDELLLKMKKVLAQHKIATGAHINSLDESGNGILHHCCYYKLHPLIADLLDHGADVNIQNFQGDTPLHIAAKNGDRTAMKLLLQSKANTNSINDKDETPIDVASTTGFQSVLHSIMTEVRDNQALENTVTVQSEKQLRALFNRLSIHDKCAFAIAQPMHLRKEEKESILQMLSYMTPREIAIIEREVSCRKLSL